MTLIATALLKPTMVAGWSVRANSRMIILKSILRAAGICVE